MHWDDALKYKVLAEQVANEWSVRVKNPEIREDLYQDLLIYMVESIDLGRVEKDPRTYIRTALWYRCHTVLLHRNAVADRQDLSLDQLVSEEGLQISEKGQVFRPHRETAVPYIIDKDPADENGN